MPRSLYGRAALILVLPVVTLQLLVSVVFVQRHFAGVTEQLTRQLAGKTAVLLDMEAGIDRDRVARQLGVRLSNVAALDVARADHRPWNDLSGIVVMQELRDRIPGVDHIVLGKRRTCRFLCVARG